MLQDVLQNVVAELVKHQSWNKPEHAIQDWLGLFGRCKLQQPLDNTASVLVAAQRWKLRHTGIHNELQARSRHSCDDLLDHVIRMLMQRVGQHRRSRYPVQ